MSTCSATRWSTPGGTGWSPRRSWSTRNSSAPAQVVEALRRPRLEWAIGVIYRLEAERQSHYLRARAADQFDAVIHIDQTRAVEPLERTAGWEKGEVPETYPFTV